MKSRILNSVFCFLFILSVNSFALAFDTGVSQEIIPVSAGGYTTSFLTIPTITAGAYSSGYCIGGLQTLSNFNRASGSSGMINAITVSDKAKQSSALAIVFFNDNPTYTTFTDHAALTIAAADLNKIVGIIQIPAANYQSFASNSVALVANIGMGYVIGGGRTMYFTIICNGTPTYTSVSDLQILITEFQD